MPTKQTTTKLLTGVSLILICTGTVLSVVKPSAMAGPILIGFSIIAFVLTVKMSRDKNLGVASGIVRDKASKLSILGDILLVVGALFGWTVLQLFNFPAKTDRGWALLFPAVIFGAGIVVKISNYIWPNRERQ